MGKERKYVILRRQSPAPDIEARIRAMTYPTDDDYWEVRRDERERIISALKGAEIILTGENP